MNAHLSKIVGEGLTYDDVLLIPVMYFSKTSFEGSKKTSNRHSHISIIRTVIEGFNAPQPMLLIR